MTKVEGIFVIKMRCNQPLYAGSFVLAGVSLSSILNY